MNNDHERPFAAQLNFAKAVQAELVRDLLKVGPTATQAGIAVFVSRVVAAAMASPEWAQGVLALTEDMKQFILQESWDWRGEGEDFIREVPITRLDADTGLDAELAEAGTEFRVDLRQKYGTKPGDGDA